jgi:hypothetical protein
MCTCTLARPVIARHQALTFRKHLRDALLEPPSSLGSRVAQRCRGHCPRAAAAAATSGSAWTRDASSHIANERSTASTSRGPSLPHTCSTHVMSCLDLSHKEPNPLRSIMDSNGRD